MGLLLLTGSLWEAPTTDGLQWYGLAESLATGRNFSLNGYDVVNRMPGYPVVLAMLFAFTGPSIFWGRLLNVVLGVLCIPLAYRLGKEIWGWRVGLATTGLLAVDPFHALWPQFFQTENLQVILISLLGVLVISKRQTIVQSELIGAVSALAVLTHPGTLPIVAALIAWHAIYWRRSALAVRRFAFLSVAFLLLMSSWTVRNWLLVGSFVPLTTGVESSGGGFVFWISNNHLTAQPGDYWGRFVTAADYDKLPRFADLQQLPADDVTGLDQKGFQYGLEYLTTHPNEIPMLLLGKFFGFWEPRLSTRDAGLVLPFMWFVLMPLYAVGLVANWRHSGKSRLVVAVVAGALVLCLIYWGGARFRAPVEVYLDIALVIGAMTSATWVRNAIVRRSVAAAPSR